VVVVRGGGGEQSVGELFDAQPGPGVGIDEAAVFEEFGDLVEGMPQHGVGDLASEAEFVLLGWSEVLHRFGDVGDHHRFRSSDRVQRHAHQQRLGGELARPPR